MKKETEPNYKKWIILVHLKIPRLTQEKQWTEKRVRGKENKKNKLVGKAGEKKLI